MAKLIITLDGVTLREYQLNTGRVTIGRQPGNDIRLDDQTVSSEHAAVQLGDPATLTDLGSTNGTFVNGDRIGKQALSHGDVIRIGHHEMKFVDEESQDMAATVVLRPGEAVAAAEASLHVLSGSKAGQVLPLEKERSAIGKPGVEVAVVVRGDEGYSLLSMKSGGDTRLNGVVLSDKPAPLHDSDLIEIAGTRLQFKIGV